MKRFILSLTLSLSATILPLGSVSPVEASNTPTPTHHPLDLSRRKYGAILPDAYYDTLSRCETGKPLGAYHNTRSYTSSIGVFKGTAFRWSGKRNLNGLTPRQLVRVADRIAFSGWDRPDGTHVWRVGPWGWGVVKANCGNLQAYICHSRHPKVQRWKRGC